MCTTPRRNRCWCRESSPRWKTVHHHRLVGCKWVILRQIMAFCSSHHENLFNISRRYKLFFQGWWWPKIIPSRLLAESHLATACPRPWGAACRVQWLYKAITLQRGRFQPTCCKGYQASPMLSNPLMAEHLKSEHYGYPRCIVMIHVWVHVTRMNWGLDSCNLLTSLAWTWRILLFRTDLRLETHSLMSWIDELA